MAERDKAECRSIKFQVFNLKVQNGLQRGTKTFQYTYLGARGSGYMLYEGEVRFLGKAVSYRNAWVESLMTFR